jgi:hypothetical protein
MASTRVCDLTPTATPNFFAAAEPAELAKVIVNKTF